MSDTIDSSHSDNLLDLLLDWISTGTWNESQEMLKANAERLLSDEALEALNVLLSSTNDEGVTRTLLRHRTILEQARAESIDAAYAEFLKPSLFNEAFNALWQADTPGQVRQAVAQHPLLLDDETINALIAMASDAEQNGNTTVAQILRLRIREVQRILQQREQARNNDHAGGAAREGSGRGEMHAYEGGIVVDNNVGNITQMNIGQYTQPDKEWQQPTRQAFKEKKDFVGRQHEVDELLTYLVAGENVTITGKVVKAATLQGMGGIGKTYLARKLAVELQDSFPGGSIWITIGPQVRTQADAQRPLSELASYAFGGQASAAGQLEPRVVAALLEEVAPGPMLVVLDDAWHEAALRFLERALPSKAVRLVTTRYANIAEIVGGHRVTLGRLTLQDGLALLYDRLGIQHDALSTTQRADLEHLVELLDGHALALDIAAARVKKLSRLQTELDNLRKGIGRGALDGLKLPESEERDTNLEKALALSYDIMTPEQKSHFRALGVFATETSITPEAAATVWGIDDLGAARSALFELEDLALLAEITESADLSYQQHGLLRVYAHALLDKEGELTSACWAHANYYTDMVARTEIADYPLLDQHIPNMLTALQWAVDNEPDLFSRLLAESSQLLIVRGQSTLLEAYLPKAVEAATAVGNKVRQANLLTSLGDLERRLGNLEHARAHYDAALPLYQAERNRLGEANLLRSLGDLEGRLGNPDQARAHYDAALPLYQAERDRLGEANLLTRLGDLERRLSNLEQARAHYDAALPLYQAERARLGEANIYTSLGDMFLAQDEQTQARTYYEQALPLFIAEREPTGQANALFGLGRIRFEQGEHAQGISDVQQAATLYHAVQDKEWAGYAEQYLAQMRARLEHPEMDVLIDFANADWGTRLQLLNEHADVLLSEQVEALLDALLKNDGNVDAIEQLRTLLRRCRTWGVDPVWHFELAMRLGDGIEIPAIHEPAVMQAATLLSRQQEDDTALEQAVEEMQTLLDRLTADVPPLFEAALLRDLADAMRALPDDHPARELDIIEAYYREALPSYEATNRRLDVAFIQRSLGDVLSEQGFYEEALAAYEEAMPLLPDTPALLRNRAEKLIHARRLEEAEADLACAVKLDGNEDSPYLWDRRAQLAIARDDGRLAGQMLDEVIRREPLYDVAFLRAQSAWLCGKLDEAQETLRQALNEANKGDQAAMRRDMQRLVSEHADIAGGDEMLGIVSGC